MGGCFLFRLLSPFHYIFLYKHLQLYQRKIQTTFWTATQTETSALVLLHPLEQKSAHCTSYRANYMILLQISELRILMWSKQCVDDDRIPFRKYILIVGHSGLQQTLKQKIVQHPHILQSPPQSLVRFYFEVVQLSTTSFHLFSNWIIFCHLQRNYRSMHRQRPN